MQYGQVGAYLALVVPVLIVFYLACLLFVRPSRQAFLFSILAGLLVGLVNMLVDIQAYNAHWWHYTLDETILHVPLPFYVSPVLIFGSLAYLLIWRFWSGSTRWISWLIMIGVPIFCSLRDIIGAVNGGSDIMFDNAKIAPVADTVMWFVAFFAGFFLFRLLVARYPYVPVDNEEEEEEEEEVQNSHQNGHNIEHNHNHA